MRLRIMITPVSKGRGRIDPRSLRLYTPKKTREYMDALRKKVGRILGYDAQMPVFEKQIPLRVDLDFIMPRPKRLFRKKDPDGLLWCPVRPDRDNLDKAILDALKGVLWEDDIYIVDGRIRKFYMEKQGTPRICLRVEEAGDVPRVLCDNVQADAWDAWEEAQGETDDREA